MVTSLEWVQSSSQLRSMSADEVRSALATTALTLAGLGAKETPEAYAAAIACDLENAAYRSSYVPTSMTPDVLKWNTSSCGLTVRSILLHAGCDSQTITPPYKPGQVMAQLTKLFDESHGKLLGMPNCVGEIVFYGAYEGKPASQHVEIVVDIDDALNVVTLVAGGQAGGFGGGTEIKTVKRTYTAEGGTQARWAQVVADDGSLGPRRSVLWVADAATLTFGNVTYEPHRVDE